MSYPVCYFAFANSSENYLGSIPQEYNELIDCLSPLQQPKGFIIIPRMAESADRLRIHLESLNLALFHFGGHANRDALNMHDQSIFMEGLAEILARNQTLKLIFLNGCLTENLAKVLLQKGDKCIIATQRKVYDTLAKSFSTHFYQAFARNKSIQEAFDFSINSIKSIYGNSLKIRKKNKSLPRIGQYRGFELSEDRILDIAPWGIYFRNENTEILNYTLDDLLIHCAITPKSILQLIENGDFQLAKEKIKQILPHSPRKGGLYLNLAISELEGRDPRNADRNKINHAYNHLIQAIKCTHLGDPTNATARRILAIIIHDHYELRGEPFKRSSQEFLALNPHWKNEKWDKHQIQLIKPSSRAIISFKLF